MKQDNSTRQGLEKNWDHGIRDTVPLYMYKESGKELGLQDQGISNSKTESWVQITLPYKKPGKELGPQDQGYSTTIPRPWERNAVSIQSENATTHTAREKRVLGFCIFSFKEPGKEVVDPWHHRIPCAIAEPF